jgi:hypothetical protein
MRNKANACVVSYNRVLVCAISSVALLGKTNPPEKECYDADRICVPDFRPGFEDPPDQVATDGWLAGVEPAHCRRAPGIRAWEPVRRLPGSAPATPGCYRQLNQATISIRSIPDTAGKAHHTLAVQQGQASLTCCDRSPSPVLLSYPL